MVYRYLCWDVNEGWENGFIVNSIEEAQVWASNREGRYYNYIQVMWVNSNGVPVEVKE
jgi:hypothetical protein